MDEAELRIKKRSPIVGLGFGITEDYGAAQILYIKRGYVPDGKGLIRNSKSLKLGDQVVIDHGLAICVMKVL